MTADAVSPTTRANRAPQRQWPPAEEQDASPLYSVSGIYAALIRALDDEDQGPAPKLLAPINHRGSSKTRAQASCGHAGSETTSTTFVTQLGAEELEGDLLSPLHAPFRSAAGLLDAPSPLGKDNRRPASLKLPLGPASQRNAKTPTVAATTAANCVPKTANIEIRLVPNAPHIPHANRAVHPFFLAGVLMHGLPTTTSTMLTGDRPRNAPKPHSSPCPRPAGWTTSELVHTCVRPCLGPTRISFVQALACEAVEVPWCPAGHFTHGMQCPTGHPPSSHASPVKHADAHSLTHKPSSEPITISIPTSCPSSRARPGYKLDSARSIISGSCAGAGGASGMDTSDAPDLQLMLPLDLEGRLAYGPINFYVAHTWQTTWEHVVMAVLQHYARLPEVVRTGGAKFVPVYYWLDVFAVPQFEMPCPEFKRPDAILSQVIGAPTCRAVLLATHPWSAPACLNRAWCLFEVHLARVLGRELQILLLDEQTCDSPSLPWSGLTQLAGSKWCTPDLVTQQVVQAVEAALAEVDLRRASARNPSDKDAISALVQMERGGVDGFNANVVAFLRPYMLAALLAALLRSEQPGTYHAALQVVRCGAFLQWPSTTYTVEPDTAAGTPDEAAAFLGLALNSWPSLSADQPESHHHATIPLQDVSFLPPPPPTGQQPASALAQGTATSAVAGGPGGPGAWLGRAQWQQQQLAEARSGLSTPLAPIVSPRFPQPAPMSPGRPGSGPSPRRHLGSIVSITKRSGLDSRNSLQSQQQQDAISRGLNRLQSSKPAVLGGVGAKPSALGASQGLSQLPELSAAGVAALSQGLQGNAFLQRLQLSGHPIGSAGMHELTEALACKRTALKCLLVRGCGLCAESGTALGQLLADSNVCFLEQLDLGDNPGLGPQGTEALASGLARNTRLRQLRVDNCEAGPESVSVLAQALVQQLALIPAVRSTETVPDKPLKADAHPPGYGVWLLDLQSNSIGPEAAEALAALIAQPRCALAYLYLAHNQVQTKGALSLAAALKHNTSLCLLQLRDNHLALEVGQAMGQALISQAHASLPVSAQLEDHASGTGHDHAKHRDAHHAKQRASESRNKHSHGGHHQHQHHVTHHATGSTLTHLDLGCNPLLGEVGVRLLAEGLQQARGCLMLHELLLDGVCCGPEGATALAQVLSNPTSDKQSPQVVGAAGAANKAHKSRQQGSVHADTQASRGLELLDLSCNQLGHSGAVALAGALEQAASLKRLLLRNCQIDAEGRLALLGALQLCTKSPLNCLDLEGNGIDPALYVPPPVNKPRQAVGRGGMQDGLASVHRYEQAELSLMAMNEHMSRRDDDLHAEPQRVPLQTGLTREESVLAQSLTLARQLQGSRKGLSILM